MFCFGGTACSNQRSSSFFLFAFPVLESTLRYLATVCPDLPPSVLPRSLLNTISLCFVSPLVPPLPRAFPISSFSRARVCSISLLMNCHLLPVHRLLPDAPPERMQWPMVSRHHRCCCLPSFVYNPAIQLPHHGAHVSSVCDAFAKPVAPPRHPEMTLDGQLLQKRATRPGGLWSACDPTCGLIAPCRLVGKS